MQKVFEKAHAKINLYLHVTGKLESGYHTLDSLFVFTDFGDDIYVQKSKETSFEISGKFSSDLKKDKKNNLVMKAYELLKKEFNINENAKITLIKNLPIASGVGGGSSDAGATIRALQKLWDIETSQEQINNLALKIGADVPSCVYAKPCFVSGVGEKIIPAGKVEEFGILLVNPLIEISTPEIFKNRRDGFSKSCPFEIKGASKSDVIKELSYRKNDLYNPASLIAPEIKDVISETSKTKGCLLSRMSGSGATCFGLYKDSEQAKQAKEELEKRLKGYWIESSKIMS
jgi:4-diphosphocytidyl-2-C-methyl-D-erythritol kinase